MSNKLSGIKRRLLLQAIAASGTDSAPLNFLRVIMISNIKNLKTNVTLLNCRFFDVPLPAPPMLVDSLLVVAMTLGFIASNVYFGGLVQ